MITSYSAGLYDALFKKAEERLNNVFNMNVTIDDLETYFYHLRDLVYGPEDAPATEEQIKEGYIFLKLPAVEQEGHFIIDANTRKIDTSGFKGLLSVQGDEIAEIVFF